MSAASASNRPRYAPIAPDPGARAHLLITDRAAVDPAALAEGVVAADFGEVWTVAGDVHLLPRPFGGPGVHAFRSVSHVLTMLGHRLAAETMGLRIYAVGLEPFVWDVARVAREAGMGREEMHLFACGEHRRRVWCVHCRTVMPDVTTTVVECTGCGAHLGVRDHFSRTQNAWMAVQVDAEVPGEVPDAEMLQP